MDDVQIEERRIEKIRLQNGLDLELCDGSRKIAGDRYRVTLIAKIRVPIGPVETKGKENPGGIGREEIARMLGDTVTFEKKMERHFIDSKEKEACLNAMKESFLSGALKYLSRSGFSEKFILKAYREASLKRRWDLDATAQ